MRATLVLLAALAVAGGPLAAQGDVATEGALFLVLPIGGRAIGVGQALVASVEGSESVWWNPAGLARQQQREIAVHHSQPFVETSANAVTFAVPSSLLGVLALSVNILDFGTETQTDPQNNPIGTITTRSFVYAATYATTAGSRLNAGVTYKLLQFQVGCSAGCPGGIGANATSSAIDVGAQYDLRGLAPVALGVAVRNLGPSLQVNDNPQRDALPVRIQAGLRWNARPLERRLRDTQVAITGDVVDHFRPGAASWRTGIDATWRKRASLRGGYIFEGSTASGPSIGFGLRERGLVLDIGWQLGSVVETTGADPTYVSLRYLF